MEPSTGCHFSQWLGYRDQPWIPGLRCSWCCTCRSDSKILRQTSLYLLLGVARANHNSTHYALSAKSFPFVLAFVDNTASLAALNKGYGRDECINRILSFLWCLLARCGMYPHFTWVQSSRNVSDKVGRHDLSDAKNSGWQILDLDISELYGVLSPCAQDMNYLSLWRWCPRWVQSRAPQLAEPSI